MSHVQRTVRSDSQIENDMIALEKIQQVGGHFPDADALGRARRILTGELTEVEAYAELDEKFPQQ